MSVQERVQTASQEDRVVVGTKETLKNVADLDEVVVAANAPDDVVAEVEEAVDQDDVSFTEFEGSNVDLGSLCGKPFAAATVGIKEASTRTL